MALRYRGLFCFATIYLIGASFTAVSAAIIHVPGEYVTIKAGILAAQTGDTVMVAAGVYSGDGNRNIDFGNKRIVVRSLKGSTPTIINCEGSKSTPHRGFRVHQGEDSGTVIEGFTVINGYAPIDLGTGEWIGGGILCENGSSPTIKDCVFLSNYAASAGGGMCCIEGSAPIVSGCAFIDNTAVGDTSTTFEGYGGGIRCKSSSPIFRDCIIFSNYSNIGGGMSCNDAHPTFENCEFSNNTADVVMTFEPAFPGIGGGLHLYYSSAILDYCVFDRNNALSDYNMDYSSAAGGGIAAYHSSLTMTNCTFYGNMAEKYSESMPGHGAGMYLYTSPAIIENSIIANNTGAEGVGCPDEQCADTLVFPTFLCTDIYGNELGDWIDSIAGQLGINGNFSEAPYFCDPNDGNLHLWINSPCSPESSECGIQIGAFGVECLSDADDPDCCPPVSFILSQNHPNPFNQSTLIGYTLPTASHIDITIYNSLGQVVRGLVSEFKPAGRHSVYWNGRDANGADVASGIYFYTIRGDEFRESKRMVLIK